MSMLENDRGLPRRGTRTWRGAWVFLGLIAVGQATMALSLAPRPAVIAVKPVPDVSALAALAAAPVHPAVLPPAVDGEAAGLAIVSPVEQDPFAAASQVADPHPEMAGPAGPAPAFDPAQEMLAGKGVITAVPRPARPIIERPDVRPKVVTAPLDTPIIDTAVITRLEEGMHLRSQGDLMGALKPLREALEKEPGHPRLIYQLARTLDSMGQMRKAQPHWEALRELGAGVGDYYQLAVTRLRDGVPVSTDPEEQMGGGLTIVSLDEQKVADAPGGERVKFLVKVKKITTDPVNVETDLAWTIHFFDSVNRKGLARSVAAPPALTPLDLPVDWAEGTESFSFEYWQPDMTPDELVAYGRCRYYGCALELSWKDKLQDATATTPELLDLAKEMPIPEQAPGDDLLHGPAPALPSDAPDPALFPPNILR